MRQETRITGLGPPVSHYTDAVRFGDTRPTGTPVEIEAVVAPPGDQIRRVQAR